MDQHGKIVETSVLVLCDIVLVIVFLLGTASNSIVLLVFYRRPGLRTLSNRFVINLLATNLLACCVLLPLVFADNVRGHGDTSPALCAVSEGVAASLCAASVLAVLLVAVDQFLAVVDPLHYHMRINAPRSAAMIATAWISAAFLGLLGAGTPLLLVGQDTGGSLWHACGAGVDYYQVQPEQLLGETGAVATGEALKSPPQLSTYRAAFAGVYAILVFAIPVVALCCIYLRIYAAAHRNSQRTRRTGSGPLCPIPQSHFEAESSAPSAPAVAQPLLPPHPTTTISITPPTPTGAATTPPTMSPSPSSPPSSPPSVPTSPQNEAVKVTPPTPPQASRTPSRTPSRAASVRSTSSQFVNSLKYRISNASLFRYREEARAARVSALVVVMALVCWFPYTAALVLHSGIFTSRLPVLPPETSSPHYMDAVSLTLLSAGSLISPCLFAYRNRRLQREVRRLLGVKRGLKQRGTMHQSHTTHHNGTFLNGGGSMHNPNRIPANYSNTALELFSSLTEGKTVGVTSAESHIGVDISDPKRRKDGCLPLPTVPPSSGGQCTGKKFLVTVYGRSRWSRNSSEKATCEFVPESALNVDTCRSSFSSGTTQGTSSTDNVEE